MNSLRRIRPAPLGRVLAAAPSRLAAAFAINTSSATAGTPTCQPRHVAQPFSPASPSLRFAASISSSSSAAAAEASKSVAPSTSTSTSTPERPYKQVPDPIPIVPDVKTFLFIIGRNMKQHTSKFPSWEALFTLSSKQLRTLGVEPARDRRYLLRWLQKFRLGEFGIGGELRYVYNGVAPLRVHTWIDPENPVNRVKTVLNVPMPLETPKPAAAEGEAAAAETEVDPVKATDIATIEPVDYNRPPVRIRKYKPVGAKGISGPYALPRPNGAAAIQVVEGMWEHKRGVKVDGGERRRAEVRFKRRVAERRAEREAMMRGRQ